MRRVRTGLAQAMIVLVASAAPALAQDRPDMSGYWGPGHAVAAEARPADMIEKLPQDTVVIEDSGAAEFPRGEYGGLKLTDTAQTRAKEWNPEADMTLSRVCLPPSIVYTIQGPFPFEIIQTPALIVFRYEYFDQMRLIYMDGRPHPPADAPHNKNGFSTGHWEGTDLVIETDHLAASTITNNGLDHDDDVRMIERYRLANDGKALIATQWFSDPAMLENNGARFIGWTKEEGYIFPYECDPSFALEYQQVGGK